jgi:hypothetical protein
MIILVSSFHWSIIIRKYKLILDLASHKMSKHWLTSILHKRSSLSIIHHDLHRLSPLTTNFSYSSKYIYVTSGIQMNELRVVLRNECT